MNACVGAGRISEATSILETMEASGLRPDVRAYNTLLKGLTGIKDLEAMERLLNNMRKRQISASVVTYNILVDAFAKEGRLEEVCIMFKSFQALSMWCQSHGQALRRVAPEADQSWRGTYNTAPDAEAKKGHLEEVLSHN